MTSEAYRVAVIDSMRGLGPWYGGKASQILGVACMEVWIHGSVLDPGEFSDRSDVDLALVVDDPAEPDGLHERFSEALGRYDFPDGVAGHVDLMVFNRTEPVGRGASPVRIDRSVTQRRVVRS